MYIVQVKINDTWKDLETTEDKTRAENTKIFLDLGAPAQNLVQIIER